MVTNTYSRLPLALLSLSASAVRSSTSPIRTFETFGVVIPHRRPGRAEAINYHQLRLQRRTPSQRLPLAVHQALLRRNRYTIPIEFSRIALLPRRKLANGISDTSRQGDIIRKFLTNTCHRIDIDLKRSRLKSCKLLPIALGRLLHGSN